MLLWPAWGRVTYGLMFMAGLRGTSVASGRGRSQFSRLQGPGLAMGIEVPLTFLLLPGALRLGRADMCTGTRTAGGSWMEALILPGLG